MIRRYYRIDPAIREEIVRYLSELASEITECRSNTVSEFQAGELIGRIAESLELGNGDLPTGITVIKPEEPHENFMVDGLP